MRLLVLPIIILRGHSQPGEITMFYQDISEKGKIPPEKTCEGLESDVPAQDNSVPSNQDKPQIEHFCKQKGNGWLFTLHTGLESEVQIESIRCTLLFRDVYDRVQFPEAGAERV